VGRQAGKKKRSADAGLRDRDRKSSRHGKGGGDARKNGAGVGAAAAAAAQGGDEDTIMNGDRDNLPVRPVATKKKKANASRPPVLSGGTAIAAGTATAARAVPGLDDIDQSLLAERSDEDMEDGDGDGDGDGDADGDEGYGEDFY
jgi:hypothetical protein